MLKRFFSLMLNWFFKLKDYLQHALFALAIMGGFAFILAGIALIGGNPVLWGAAFIGVAFYAGREQRDTENADPSLFDNPKSLAFWKWRRDQLTDFLAPLGGNVALAALIEFL